MLDVYTSKYIVLSESQARSTIRLGWLMDPSLSTVMRTGRGGVRGLGGKQAMVGKKRETLDTHGGNAGTTVLGAGKVCFVHLYEVEYAIALLKDVLARWWGRGLGGGDRGYSFTLLFSRLLFSLCGKSEPNRLWSGSLACSLERVKRKQRKR